MVGRLPTRRGDGEEAGEEDGEPDGAGVVIRATLRQNVIALLKSRAGQWVDGHELAKAGGTFAFRTRISEARRLDGLDIVNRTRRIRLANGDHFTVTEYQYRPASLLEMCDAH